MRLKFLIKWDMRFLARYGFYFLYGFLTLLYVVLLLSFPQSWKEKIAAILIFSDPAAMGLFFMGAIILLEKSQRVTSLFAVSPLKESEYIGSKVLSISLIAVFVAGVTPVLAGVAIHFAVPFIEKILIRYTGIPAMLAPYYGLLDIFLASITPTMYCFIVAIVILEERDDHIDRYLFVTSLGRKGYYISRIFIPALLTFLVTVSLLPIFCLSELSIWGIMFLSLTGTLQGIIIALLVTTLSSNKLEGMAVTKIATLTIMGAVIPYFVPEPVSFLFVFLPSFWSGMAIRSQTMMYLLPSLMIAGVWILALLPPIILTHSALKVHYRR